MKKLTILLIPEGARTTHQISIPRHVIRGAQCLCVALAGLSGYFLLDYLQLREIRTSYRETTAENQGLRGEAKLLMNNLDEVKRSLRRVQDYSAKLADITKLKVIRVSKKTGIGPLSADEFAVASARQSQEVIDEPREYVPLGVNLDKLVFRTAFDRMKTLGKEANQSALDLQHLLSTLSQQKSLLSAIPSNTPVNGWIASGFGQRTSPFTGERVMHMGIDVASPIGSPIYAPADGVVIFTGEKEGFGNFIMLAHGYGLISRYGHNAQNLVETGQTVKRGEQIATVGMTGRTTGPHLHYEIIVDGRPVDPKKFILDMAD